MPILESNDAPQFAGRVKSFSEIKDGKLGGYVTVQRYIQFRRSYFVRLVTTSDGSDNQLKARYIRIIEAFDAADSVLKQLMEHVK